MGGESSGQRTREATTTMVPAHQPSMHCWRRVLLHQSLLSCKSLGNLQENLVTLQSRLSFPATGPPDPGRVSEGYQKGSLKGSLKGFWRGQPRTPSKTLQSPLQRPLLKQFWNPSGVGGSCSRKWKSWHCRSQVKMVGTPYLGGPCYRGVHTDLATGESFHLSVKCLASVWLLSSNFLETVCKVLYSSQKTLHKHLVFFFFLQARRHCTRSVNPVCTRTGAAKAARGCACLLCSPYWGAKAHSNVSIVITSVTWRNADYYITSRLPFMGGHSPMAEKQAYHHLFFSDYIPPKITFQLHKPRISGIAFLQNYISHSCLWFRELHGKSVWEWFSWRISFQLHKV